MKKLILMTAIFGFITINAQEKPFYLEYEVIHKPRRTPVKQPHASFVEDFGKKTKHAMYLVFNEDYSIYSSLGELPEKNGAVETGFKKIEDPTNTYSLEINVKGSSMAQHFNDLKNKTHYEVFDKYVVKSELSNAESYWTLHDESKIINGYTCKKATKERTSFIYKSSSMTGDSKEKISYTTTAWYAVDLEFPTGPLKFHGLPGLILELNSYSYDIKMKAGTEIKNTKEPIDFEIPKGKIISMEEYKAIRKKELAEKYRVNID